jgi:DNA-directed RNA polymerase specialized sigma24 family protein
MPPISAEQLQSLYGQAAGGCQEATALLWQHYYQRLKLVVQRRIADLPKLTGEGSDLTSEALQGFLCNTVRSTDLDLSDINAIWCLLKTITRRHVNDVLKARMAEKRGGQATIVSLDTVKQPNSIDGDSRPAISLVTMIPDDSLGDPDAKLQFDELVDSLLGRLPTDVAKQIVLMKLENRSNGDIAELLNLSIRTVQRQLQEVKKIWNTIDGDSLE